MKKSTMFLLTVLFVFSSAFLIIGYASISRELKIKGDANIKPVVKKLYISDVQYSSSSNATNVSFEYLYPTNFTNTVNATNRNGSITYEVTVHNNTDITYWYHGIIIEDKVEDNNLISKTNGITISTKDKLTDSYASFDKEDWIPPKSYRTFYVTYTFGSNAQSYRVLFVNFHFDIRMDAVYDGFLAILNDKTGQYGYHYLAQEFDKKYKETGSTVIGNIGEDKEIFDNLFGEDLKIEVNGVLQPVTVLVRRDNVDKRTTGDSYSGGPSGCEYTVYITVDDLSNSGGKATVFAISYTINSNGEVWYQLAELYEGEATIADYDKTDGKYEGSIDVSTWLAVQKDYSVADGIVYKVGYGQGDQYDKLKKLEDLMSTQDQDIFNDIDNTKIMKKVYDIINANKNDDSVELQLLRKAYNKALPFFNNFNNGQEFKVKRDYTRAQLLPMLEELQEAINYYNQVH